MTRTLILGLMLTAPSLALAQDRPRFEAQVCTFLPSLGLFSDEPTVQVLVPLRRQGLDVEALDSGQRVIASTATGVTIATGDNTIRIEGDRATYQRGLHTLHGGCTDVAARVDEFSRMRAEVMQP